MTSRMWPQPEQDSQAHKTWSNIVENSTNIQDTNRAVFNSPEDFIPLDSERSNDDLFSRSTGKDAKQLKRKLPSNEKAQQNGTTTTTNGPWGSTESDYTPWKRKDYSQDPTGLNEEIQDFLNYIKPRPEEDAIRRDVVERVEAVIKELWPRAKVELYGSCQTGLYLPTSDIDLVVHGKWQSLPLRTLENALLEREIADANSIRVLDKATVPIIKITDKKTEVKVDISFNMNTGVQSADMIKSYMKQYPALPYLTFVLKQFLLNRDLNEVFSGGISSYTVVLMIVSYFQHSGHFNGMERDVNLGVLLIEFFELYGKNFNYNNVGIRLVGNGSYFNKEKVLGNAIANTTHLCIEDPLTEGNFIGKNSFRISEVKRVFIWACSVLSHGVLNKIPGNESCSILGRVTRIHKETIEQRERTMKLAIQFSTIPTMPSYASVATRNTRTTTIRSINGEKTIDLVTRPETRLNLSPRNHTDSWRKKHSPDSRTNNHDRTAGFEKIPRNPTPFDHRRQYVNTNELNGKSRNRDRQPKERTKIDRKNNTPERTSYRDKGPGKQRPHLSPNHKPTSPKRTPPPSSSITETCAMRSTKGAPSSLNFRYILGAIFDLSSSRAAEIKDGAQNTPKAETTQATTIAHGKGVLLTRVQCILDQLEQRQ